MELKSHQLGQQSIGVLVKRLLGLFGILVLIACGVFYSWSENIASASKLPTSKSVEVHITSGGVTILGTATNDYRVTTEGASLEGEKDAKISIQRDQQPVVIKVSGLPQGSRARIEIPQASNLAVKMGAGELLIQGVQGDTYAMLRAGKMVIDVGQRSEYSSAKASVFAGAIKAPAFALEKGGMFRFFTFNGSGSSTLQAHVTSGELTLQSSPSVISGDKSFHQ